MRDLPSNPLDEIKPCVLAVAPVKSYKKTAEQRRMEELLTKIKVSSYRPEIQPRENPGLRQRKKQEEKSQFSNSMIQRIAEPNKFEPFAGMLGPRRENVPSNGFGTFRPLSANRISTPAGM